MKKFNKIVCVDNTKLTGEAIEELQKWSKAPIDDYRDFPASDEETMARIGDAEAVLVSWKTQIGAGVIKNCRNLKYIGMACSLYDDASANVAVKFARDRGIKVTGIFDYGDPGVTEFIISELIRLLHGFGKQQWQEMPVELTNRKIGIIGLGTTGKMLADCLLPFGPELFYFSRSRKKDYEDKGVKYLPLDELLKTSEIISIHLPKNIKILKEEEFEHFGNGKILINTSLGLPVDAAAFAHWIRKEGNYAIFDGDGKAGFPGELLKFKNILAHPKSAGWSAETQKRLSEKVLDNVKEFFG